MSSDPVQGYVLVGHFLTRAQVAFRTRIGRSAVPRRPDLLRVGGTWLEEVYFAFQFDAYGIKLDLGHVVAGLRRSFGDESIADWLVRPHKALSSTSPLAWLAAGGEPERVSRALRVAGPIEVPRIAGTRAPKEYGD